jgi:hypothetical protein
MPCAPLDALISFGGATELAAFVTGGKEIDLIMSAVDVDQRGQWAATQAA